MKIGNKIDGRDLFFTVLVFLYGIIFYYGIWTLDWFYIIYATIGVIVFGIPTLINLKKKEKEEQN